MRSGQLLFCALLAALAGCDGDPSTSERDGSLPPGTDGGTLPTGADAGPPAPGSDGGSPDRDAAPATPSSPLVDPGCTDGAFSETLPDSSASISDLVAAYDPDDPTAFIEATLARRYPTGLELVEGGQSRQDCVTVFLRDTSSAEAIIPQISTVVHECGHFHDGNLSSFDSNTYVINDSPLSFSCAQGDTTERSGRTFARSRIRDDDYAPLRPACGGTFGPDCDFYADIYLDGDPDDSSFDGGDQGFNMLLEEAVQYVNSLATGLAYTNELAGPRSVTERDGILTFLWYLQRYLRLARLSYPSAYQHLLEGAGGCWREAILTVWGRAWLYLEATASMSHLGIDDDALQGLVEEPELLAEIQRLRDAQGCPAP